VVTITHQPKIWENKRNEFQVKKAEVKMLLKSRVSDRATTLCTAGLPLLLGPYHGRLIPVCVQCLALVLMGLLCGDQREAEDVRIEASQ